MVLSKRFGWKKLKVCKSDLFSLENWCAEKLEKIKVSKNVVDYFQNYVEESCEVLKEETDFIVSETHEVSVVFF